MLLSGYEILKLHRSVRIVIKAKMKETTLSSFSLILHAEFIFAADMLEQHDLAHTIHQAEFFSKSWHLRGHISRSGLQKLLCMSAIHQAFQLSSWSAAALQADIRWGMPFTGQWNAAGIKGLWTNVQSTVTHLIPRQKDCGSKCKMEPHQLGSLKGYAEQCTMDT